MRTMAHHWRSTTVVAVAVAGAAAIGTPIPSPLAAPVAALRSAAAGPTSLSWSGGFPVAVQTDVAVPGRDAAEQATNYLRQFGELYGQHHDPFAVPTEPLGRLGIDAPGLDRSAALRDLARGGGKGSRTSSSPWRRSTSHRHPGSRWWRSGSPTADSRS